MMRRPQAASAHDEQLAAGVRRKAHDLVRGVSYGEMEITANVLSGQELPHGTRRLLSGTATPLPDHVIVRRQHRFEVGEWLLDVDDLHIQLAEPTAPFL